MGLPSLCDSEGSGPSGKHWQGDARKNKAGQDGHGQDVFLDLVVPHGVCDAKHDVLYLVIDSTTCLKGI